MNLAPAAAFDRFMTEEAPASRQLRLWTPADGPMPALYLSHGAPPLFDDPQWIAELFGWAQSLPKPTGIVIVSGHWEAAPVLLSAPGARTPLVYDFGGFAARYFEMTYQTPDAGALAARVMAEVSPTEPIFIHRRRGLDHGAWVPLKTMYPYADVPVLQMSIPTHDPERLLRIGRRLRALRDEGVMVIGSGFMTHGVPYLTREQFDRGIVPAWSKEFDTWAAEALAGGNVDTLLDYRAQAPGLAYAHPTVDHWVPLFITLGAAADAETPARTTIEGFRFGLSKRSLQVA